MARLKRELATIGMRLAGPTHPSGPCREGEQRLPWVLMLNKRDRPDLSTRDEIVAALHAGDQPPMFETVACKGIGVAEALADAARLALAHVQQGCVQGGAAAELPRRESPPRRPSMLWQRVMRAWQNR